MRLYINDNRISTAVKVKSGGLLQVYPVKKPFANEVDWQNHWAELSKPKIILRFGDGVERSVAPAPAPIVPKPAPVLPKAKLSDWNFTKSSKIKVTLPAGRYYIGDLCYVLSDEDWNTYCAAFDWGKSCDTHNEEDGYDCEIWLAPDAVDTEGWLNDTGAQPWRPCYTFNTAYGDGCYLDQEGRQYCVDSGGIGAIRTDHANPEKLAEAVSRGLGHLHEMKVDEDGLTSGMCGYDKGVLYFDHVEIDTAGSPYEDEEEEETEEYDG